MPSDLVEVVATLAPEASQDAALRAEIIASVRDELRNSTALSGAADDATAALLPAAADSLDGPSRAELDVLRALAAGGSSPADSADAAARDSPHFSRASPPAPKCGKVVAVERAKRRQQSRESRTRLRDHRRVRVF